MNRFILPILGLIGALMFGSVFVVSLANPSILEQVAKTFLSRQMARELKLDVVGDGTSPSPEASFDRVVGSLPPRTKELEIIRPRNVREGFGAGGVSNLPGAADGWAAMADDTYSRLVAGLVYEIRVFAGCNFALFALTALLAGWRRRDLVPLALPAAILAVTTCLTVIVYLAAQSWFWTFFTGDYVGYWYVAWVGAVASLLADIACNRARMTSVIVRYLWHWPA